MPTDRKRHMVTETDEVAAALDEAAQQWPEETSRSRLLVRLVREGHRVISGSRARESERRHDAVARTSGALTGVYGEGYLDRLREDWAE